MLSKSITWIDMNTILCLYVCLTVTQPIEIRIYFWSLYVCLTMTQPILWTCSKPGIARNTHHHVYWSIFFFLRRWALPCTSIRAGSIAKSRHRTFIPSNWMPTPLYTSRWHMKHTGLAQLGTSAYTCWACVCRLITWKIVFWNVKNLAASQAYTFQHFQMATCEVNLVLVDEEGCALLERLTLLWRHAAKNGLITNWH